MMSVDGHLDIRVSHSGCRLQLLTSGQEIRRKVPRSLICVLRFHSNQPLVNLS